jgi:hypothetical protein
VKRRAGWRALAGEHGLRTLKELVRSYLTVTKDLGRVTSRSRMRRRLYGSVRGVLSDDRPYRVTFGETYAPMGVKL